MRIGRSRILLPWKLLPQHEPSLLQGIGQCPISSRFSHQTCTKGEWDTSETDLGSISSGWWRGAAKDMAHPRLGREIQ